MSGDAAGSPGARIVAVLRLTVARTLRPVPLLLGLLLAALPMIFAAVYRAGSPVDGSLAPFLLRSYDTLVVSMLLPLAALLTAAAATSAEREDGTILYLLTTTTSRWLIVMVRWVFAVVLTAALVAVAVLATGLVAGGASEPSGVMVAFLVGSAVGAAVYSAIFLALSVWLRRSLLVGLVYVLVWEGVIVGNLPALRYLSARKMLLGITQGFVQEADRGATVFAGAPGMAASTGWAVVVLVGALGLAGYRLQRLPLTRAR